MQQFKFTIASRIACTRIFETAYCHHIATSSRLKIYSPSRDSKNAFHLVRALAIQRNGKESWDRAVSTDSEMLSQALTQTSNHTSTYLLATRGGANEAFETFDVLRFRRELNGIRRRKKKKKKNDVVVRRMRRTKPERVRLEFRHDPISPSIDTASLPLDLVKLGEHEISASILGLQDRASIRSRFERRTPEICSCSLTISLRR